MSTEYDFTEPVYPSCATCCAPMLSQSFWRRISDAERGEWVEDGFKQDSGTGNCVDHAVESLQDAGLRRCTRCGRQLVAKVTWRLLEEPTRQAYQRAGLSTAGALGLCQEDYNAHRRGLREQTRNHARADKRARGDKDVPIQEASLRRREQRRRARASQS